MITTQPGQAGRGPWEAMFFVAAGNLLSPEQRGKFLGTVPLPDCENSHFIFSFRQDREFLEPHC